MKSNIAFIHLSTNLSVRCLILWKKPTTLPATLILWLLYFTNRVFLSSNRPEADKSPTKLRFHQCHRRQQIQRFRFHLQCQELIQALTAVHCWHLNGIWPAYPNRRISFPQNISYLLTENTQTTCRVRTWRKANSKVRSTYVRPLTSCNHMCTYISLVIGNASNLLKTIPQT